MGNCCTWKSGLEGAGEMQMKVHNYSIENISKILNHDRTTNMFKVSTFMNDKENIPEFIFQQEKLFKNINDIINSNNNISTINIESLWNITKYYKQDFTNCSYILYDLRKKENKVENFLKKYKCINYNIGEIQTFSGNRLKMFKNFIRNKNIIIIPKNQDMNELKKISNFIDLLNDESLCQQQFFILTFLLNIKEDDIPDYFYNYKLYKKIDDKDFEIYPNILFPLSEIKYLNNYNYIYIQQKEIDSSFYLSNKEFINFLKAMNIKLIIDIDEAYNHQEKPEKICLYENNYEHNNTNNIDNNENKKQDDLYYFKINSKDYFNNNILKLFLYYLRFFFLSQGTLLIFYNERINDKKELSKWISYILSNSFFIYEEEGAMLTESEILAKNIQSMSPIYFQPKFIEDSLIVDIEENYSSKDYNSEPYDSKQNEIIQGIKNLWQVKKEKNTFFEIICIIEKLLLNIILNPGNERYYKIKKTSRTIQTLIINIPEANYLFQMIGFKLDDNNEFYSIDKNIDIRKIEDTHKFLLYAVNKIINDPDY
jgi:hypothetical protein